MAAESLVQDMDAQTMLTLLKLGGTELDEASDGDDQTVGQRLGAAIGASIGRAIGETIGKRVIDEVLLAGDSADESETEEGEQAEETDSEEEEEPEDDDRPQHVDDLEDMSYRELQTLAKDVGVKANLARDEMTDEVAETLDLSQ